MKGGEIMKGYTRKFRITEQDFEVVKLLRRQGLSHKKIGAVVGIAPGTSYMLSKFETLEDYQKVTKERLAKSKENQMPETTQQTLSIQQTENNEDLYKELRVISTTLQKLLLIEERKEAHRQEMAKRKRELYSNGHTQGYLNNS
jgi:hypothetical protein